MNTFCYFAQNDLWLHPVRRLVEHPEPSQLAPSSLQLHTLTDLRPHRAASHDVNDGVTETSRLSISPSYLHKKADNSSRTESTWWSLTFSLSVSANGDIYSPSCFTSPVDVTQQPGV